MDVIITTSMYEDMERNADLYIFNHKVLCRINFVVYIEHLYKLRIINKTTNHQYLY